MPYAVVSSQAPVPRRPQTSKAAKRAYNKRKSARPSEKDLKRIAREEKQERLAADKKRRVQRRKENEKRRAEEREKERQKIKLLGVEEVVKVEEGQLRIAGFLKAVAGKSIKEEDSKKICNEEHTPEKGEDRRESCVEASSRPKTSAPGSQQPGIHNTETRGGGSTEAKASQKSLSNADILSTPLPKSSGEPFIEKSNFDSQPKKSNHQISPQRPRPLSEISANVQQTRMASPQAPKRKILLETDDCWADFFTSGTQIERELALPIADHSTKRQCSTKARYEVTTASSTLKDLVALSRTHLSSLIEHHSRDTDSCKMVRAPVHEPRQIAQRIDKTIKDSGKKTSIGAVVAVADSSDQSQNLSNKLSKPEDRTESATVSAYQTISAIVPHVEPSEQPGDQFNVHTKHQLDLEEEDDELDNFLLALASTQELNAVILSPAIEPDNGPQPICEQFKPIKRADPTEHQRLVRPDPALTTSFDFYDDLDISSEELAALVP